MTNKTDKINRKKLLGEYWAAYHKKHHTVEKLDLLFRLQSVFKHPRENKLSQSEYDTLSELMMDCAPDAIQRGYNDMFVDALDIECVRALYRQFEDRG